MAVHASLARCLRATPSSILLRPIVQSSTPVHTRVYQAYQRAGYSSTDSPDTTKAKQTTPTTGQGSSSSLQQAPAAPSKDLESSVLDKLNLGHTSSFQTTDTSSTVESTADQADKLAERMADIRSKMSELSSTTKYGRKDRAFFGLSTARGSASTNSTSASSAEEVAKKTLDRLVRNVPSASEAAQRHIARYESMQVKDDESGAVVRGPRSSMSRLDDMNAPKLKPIAMKLGTKLGRQVLVQNERGIDCASAIRTLQINCTTNGVRRQANFQKFHVRRGQRRKDLKSQRWRRLFKFSFDETVKKIQRMRNQGW